MATILIVDDDSAVTELLTVMLGSLGYTTESLVDAKFVFHVLEDVTIDLILLDINMPEPNGFEVCRKIRTDPVYRHLPVIMLTVKKTPLSQSKGLDLGADDYIVKPFQQEELRARIKSVVDRSRRQNKQEELA